MLFALSEANSVRVIRFPGNHKTDFLAEGLPEGFMERIGEKGGMVVENWALQARILLNDKIGGLLEFLEFSAGEYEIWCSYCRLDQRVNASD